MSHVTTLPAALGLHRPAWQRFADRAFAGLRNGWQRWQRASRMRAELAAVRGLDRRVRQDLGLADDGPWDGVHASHYDRMRW